MERQLLGLDPGSEHGSDNSQNSDDEVDQVKPTSAFSRLEMADHFDPSSFAASRAKQSGASEHPLPQAPLRIQACSAEVTSATANRQRRGESWGVFYLAPIYTQGVRTGYGAICGLHQNSDDVPGTSCRKALTTGDLPEEECRVRLKRWLMAGLDDKNWPAGQERSLHLSMGGLRLVDFSSGESEDALDRKVLRHLKKTAALRFVLG